MKPLLFLTFIGAFSLIITNTPTATGAAAPNPKPDGEKIYKIYCIACHGLSGDMGASGAAKLTESKLTLDERVKVITNGRNAMTSFKALLTPDKIQAVAKYTIELKKKK
jgi:mono/diheme cytochrome c family protein